MNIIFADLQKPVCDALQNWFSDLPNVVVHNSDIFDHKADAIISPANSFGFMDGGIDYFYTKYFGPDLQHRLQDCINRSFDGELLVGQVAVVKTYNDYIPYLISAPTMRTPRMLMGLPNVYLCFKAAIRIAIAQNFTTILSP